MSVIKNIAFCNRFKIIKNPTFNQLQGQGVHLLSPVVDLLHYWLPLGAKFLIEDFVGFEEGKPVGFIGLQATRGNKQKVKITNFILEKNHLELGESLINFAVMKYCSIGANSFNITIREDDDDIKGLFIRKCGFRLNSGEIIFDLKNNYIDREKNFSPFKPYRQGHLKPLVELYNAVLAPQYKYNFYKTPVEFESEFVDNRWAYVLENESTGQIYGFLTIATVDNKNYVFECFLNSAFGSYFSDVIAFANMQISRRTQNSNIYMKLKNCYHNSEELIQYAFSKEFEVAQRNVILTKDFLKTVSDNVGIQNSKIIFNDITPAFNK